MPAASDMQAAVRRLSHRPQPRFVYAQPAQPNRPAESTTALIYRRKARRLRLLYAKNPALLQHNLCELSSGYDVAHPRIGPVQHLSEERSLGTRASSVSVPDKHRSCPTPFGRAVVDWFADHVGRQVDTQLLHFSGRNDLLKTADRLGIGRFPRESDYCRGSA